MKLKKIIFLAFLVLFLAIQFVPVERTNPPVVSDFRGPEEVKKILVRSCYDCHSNETNWPWYSKVAPVSWLVAHDVEEAREELNFSDWDQFRSKRRLIRKIYKETEEGEMPLPIYLPLHPSVKLSDEDLAVLKEWTSKY
jgi:hypothetical protein